MKPKVNCFDQGFCTSVRKIYFLAAGNETETWEENGGLPLVTGGLRQNRNVRHNYLFILCVFVCGATTDLPVCHHLYRNESSYLIVKVFYKDFDHLSNHSLTTNG